MNFLLIVLATLYFGVTGCQADELPQNYEYLTYRAYDERGDEVEHAGFLAESVFIPLGFRQHPPKRFKAGSGRCAELLSRVKDEHIRLAYAAYRSDESSQPLATINL